MPGACISAAMEAILMIRPLPCFNNIGTNALQPLTTPMRLMLICHSQSSSDSSSNQPPEATPALLINTSTPCINSSQLWARAASWRSEEHTSELQSRENLVCRLLLEKKKKHNTRSPL